MSKTLAERLMGMTDETWKRHANPWSGWSRLSVAPLFVIVIWCRQWLGWWTLVPLLLVVFWTWWNPRAFRPVSCHDNWMSHAVLGERIWIKRREKSIPAHHCRMPIILATISGVGLAPLAWGLWQLEIWPVLLGLALVIGGKLWFLDRMVWLKVEVDGRLTSESEP